VGKSKNRPDSVIELIVGPDESLKIRIDGKPAEALPARNLAVRVRQAQAGDANTPVVISADRNVKYEAVVKVMDTLQRAGIQRVGLAVKSSGA
jgi:biopolymer transport protein TolR